MTTDPVRPVVLRGGAIEDPLRVVLGFLPARGPFDLSGTARPGSFGEPDLRLANRGGARISAAQIAAILERRGAIEDALRAIVPDASLLAAANEVPWLPLRQLFGAFADIRGVGLAKTTKALYPKRPALIPMLDSIVRRYLQDDDLGAQARFDERALGLVRGYQRDLDRNRAAVQAVRQELAQRGYDLTEVRILDLLIWSAQVPARSAGPLPGGMLLRLRVARLATDGRRVSSACSSAFTWNQAAPSAPVARSSRAMLRFASLSGMAHRSRRRAQPGPDDIRKNVGRAAVPRSRSVMTASASRPASAGRDWRSAAGADSRAAPQGTATATSLRVSGVAPTAATGRRSWTAAGSSISSAPGSSSDGPGRRSSSTRRTLRRGPPR